MNSYVDLLPTRKEAVILLKYYHKNAPNTWLVTSGSCRFERWMQWFHINLDEIYEP